MVITEQYPAISTFLNYLKFEKRYSQHTIISYENDLNQFFSYLLHQYPDTTINDVKSMMVRSWLAQLKGEEDLTAKSINRKISALKSFFKYQMKLGLLLQTPMGTIVAPKITKRLPSFIQESQLDTLFHHVEFADNWQGRTEKLVLDLFYATGMRLSELIQLKESQIDSSYRQIKVLGKRNKERIIPLAKPLYALLKVYIDQKNELGFTSTDKLIVTDKGTAAYPQLIYRLVKQALGEVSTQDKKSPHILRHSFATALLNKGAELTAIKELLGHANLSATQVYTHNSIEKLKSIYKQAHPKA